MEFEHTVQQLREEVAVLQAKLQQAEEKIQQLEEENDLLALENDLLRTKVNTQQLDKESKDSTAVNESVKQVPLEMIAAGNNDYAKRAIHTLANACGGKNMICVAYFLSPDCEELPDMIVCGGVDGVITGYDLQMGVKMFSVRASAPLLCMASAGAYVACGTMDGSLAVLHFADLSATTPLVTTYTHHSNKPVCVWHHTSKYIYCNSEGDSAVYVYDLCTQRVSLKLHGHGNVVRGLAAHPFKASLASASYDKSVIVWGE
eukprot:gene28909-34885_t